jgi:hypothetical protein
MTSKYKFNMKGWFKDSWRHMLAAKGIKTRKFLLEKAWPYGEDQTRIKLLRGKKFELEPTSIDVIQSNLPKTHRSPVTEKEIKGMIEMMTPEELKASVKKVEIKAPSSMLLGASGTYGQAFTEGRIVLFTKPFRSRKTKPSTFVIAGMELTPEEARKEYLYDVLPHEIGHEVLGYKSTRKNIPHAQSEEEAEKFAQRFRKRMGLPEELNYVTRYSEPHSLKNILLDGEKVQKFNEEFLKQKERIEREKFQRENI